MPNMGMLMPVMVLAILSHVCQRCFIHLSSSFESAEQDVSRNAEPDNT